MNGQLSSTTASDYHRLCQDVSDYNEVVTSKLLIQLRSRIVSQEEHEDVVPGRSLTPVVCHCHTAGLSAVLVQKERSRYAYGVDICIFVCF